MKLNQLSKKSVAILAITGVLMLAALGLGIAIMVKFSEQWKLLLSFAVIGGAAAGLIVYIVQYLKKQTAV